MTSYKPTEPREWASTSHIDDLPNLAVLQTWVHRPAAMAKCTISDVYRMRALAKGVQEGVTVGYASRDVFLLNRFPCRMVELVGWVAGVDEKEKSQTVYLDDGDGQHILQVTIKLSLAARDPTPKPTSTPTDKAPPGRSKESQSSTCFVPARERALRKVALEKEHAQQSSRPLGPPLPVYLKHDIRVGDTVRVRGRIDEWFRGKEYIRQVAVEPGAGGSISVVDPDQQYLHMEQVMALHETTYSHRFILPPLPLPTQSNQSQSQGGDLSADTTFASLDSTMPSSEIGSEASVDFEQLKLCKPSRLRPSQLTDQTFKQYLLDYMTQQTVSQIESLAFQGADAVKQALRETFPEFNELFPTPSDSYSTPRKQRMPFTPRHDQVGFESDQNLTPRARPFRGTPKSDPSSRLQGFTIASILSVPHLEELADLVAEETSRKEEKRRRKRIRDGTCTPQEIESQATSMSLSHSQKREWRLTPSKKRARMERLAAWAIRHLSQDGVLVQVQNQNSGSVFMEPDSNTDSSSYHRRPESTTDESAYLPLPESLLFPLLIPHIQAEMIKRSKLFIRRTDHRCGHGILLEEIAGRLRGSGEEGWWQRVGGWVVEDALVWGEGRGEAKKVGAGWIIA